MNFNITVQPAGVQFEVADDEAILPAAIRAGIGLPYGCRDGACGSCKSRLLEGRVVHGTHQAKALSAAEEAAGLILTCCATPQSDCVVEARVAAAGALPVVKIPVRVTSIDKPAPDVAILRLQLPANNAFRWRAGQYIEFILRDGARRSYSVANAPPESGAAPLEAVAAPAAAPAAAPGAAPAAAAGQAIELHIRHMPGGKFTDHVFGAMKEREILRAEGPFGSFYLRGDSSKPMVLLASGTGFAPIKAIIETLRASGSTRPAVLYWGCRTPGDLYLHEWALQAAAELPWLSYVPVLSDARPEHGWAGRSGFVHHAVMADLPDLSGHQVYACGVPVMVDSAQRDLVERCGLPAEEFYADAFTSEADKH